MTIPTTARRTALVLAASSAIAATSLATAAAPADAATKLHCTASASPSNPKQYSTTHINVNGNKAGAKIRTVAHYKTKDTPHSATANRNGNASILYKVSSSTKGYKVKVNVTLTSGSAHTSCSTAFTAR